VEKVFQGSVEYATEVGNRLYVRALPVRRIAFTTPPEERARWVEEGKALAERMIKEIIAGSP